MRDKQKLKDVSPGNTPFVISVIWCVSYFTVHV